MGFGVGVDEFARQCSSQTQLNIINTKGLLSSPEQHLAVRTSWAPSPTHQPEHSPFSNRFSFWNMAEREAQQKAAPWSTTSLTRECRGMYAEQYNELSMYPSPSLNKLSTRVNLFHLFPHLWVSFSPLSH